MSGYDPDRVMNRARGHREAAVKNAQEAVRDEPADYPQEAVLYELESLWSDLEHDIDWAHNGAWSGACENRVWRIVCLTRAFGWLLPWERVPVSLLTSGMFEAIMDCVSDSYGRPDSEVLETVRKAVHGAYGPEAL